MNLKLVLMLRMTVLAIAMGAVASAGLIWRTTSKLQAEAGRNADIVAKLVTDQMSQQLSGLELIIGKPDLSRFAEFSEITRLCVRYFDMGGRLAANSCSQSSDETAEYRPPWFERLVHFVLNSRVAESAESSAYAEINVRRKVLWYQPYGIGLDIGRSPGRMMGEVLVSVDATREAQLLWNEVSQLLLWTAITIGAFNLLIYVGISRALRPTDDVLAGLAKLEQGDLNVRLPRFKLIELQRISSVFNHMAENLQQKTRGQQRLAEKLLNVQEAERRFIARELHDEFGQCMASLNADAACIVDAATRDRIERPALVASGHAIVRTVGHMMESLYGILQRLRPVGLEEYGLVAGLQSLVARWEFKAGGKCVYKFEAVGSFDDVSDEIAINLYRIVQECLTNAAKHSGASKVDILLTRDCELSEIELQISDDGNARPEDFVRSARAAQEETKGGFGLVGLHERIVALGGEIDFSILEPQGLRVTIHVPWSGA